MYSYCLWENFVTLVAVDHSRYQCKKMSDCPYGVLQAGQFGAAQSREQLIILAEFPELSLVFKDSSAPLRSEDRDCPGYHE